MSIRTNVLLGSLFSLSMVLGACGDDSASTGGGDAGGGDAGGAGGALVGTGAAGTGGASGVEASVLAPLDAAAFELPEGLAIDGDRAIVGYAFTGQIESVDLATGERTPLASVPPPPPNTAFMTGVDADADGRILAAYVSFTADAAPGIYRTPVGGGEGTLWASHPDMVFPNGLARGSDGTLFVADSAYGGVFAIDSNGVATAWAQDPLLAGAPEACGQPADSLSVGANGVVWTPDGLIVASSNQALVAKIPFQPDGSAGPLTVIAGPNCELLGGIDGLTLDEDGAILGAVNRSNTIVRIPPTGNVEPLYQGTPLDFPASLALGGTGSGRGLYVTSFALNSYLSGGTPAPAVVKLTLP